MMGTIRGSVEECNLEGPALCTLSDPRDSSGALNASLQTGADFSLLVGPNKEVIKLDFQTDQSRRTNKSHVPAVGDKDLTI